MPQSAAQSLEFHASYTLLFQPLLRQTDAGAGDLEGAVGYLGFPGTQRFNSHLTGLISITEPLE